jgi:hypothetical protein
MLKYAGRSIPLVYIQVNYQNSRRQSAVEQVAGRHCLIIEAAEALSPVGKSMVGATGYIKGASVFEGVQGALECSL